MKKILLFASALALAAGAQAETLEVDYASTTNYAGSSWEDGPVNFGYKNSGIQVLYTPDQLQSAIDNNGAVKSLTFRYYNEMSFEDIALTATAYLDVVDYNKFEKDAAGKYHYATFSTDHKATYSETISMMDYYYAELEVTFTFDKPIQLKAGKALQFTMFANCDPCTENTHYVAGFCTEPSRDIRVLYFSSDKQSAEEGLVAGTECQFGDYNVPVVKIEYDKVQKCEAPVIAPASGTALGPNEAVTITCPTEGAQIFFSVDGSEADSLYTMPFAITGDCTVAAVATKDGFIASDTVKAQFVRKFTEAPTYDPAVGRYLGSDDKVTLICATEGASIYFSVDGTEPDSLYTEPFAITDDTKVKAKAVAPGFFESEEVEIEFLTRKAERPSFLTREYAVLNHGDAVRVNVPKDHQVKYSFTADMADAKVYNDSLGIAIDGECTVYIVGTREGYYDSKPVKSEFGFEDITTLKLGGYDTTQERFAGSNFYNAPLIFVYRNSATQTLYTAEEMAPLAGKSVKKISYVYNNEMCFEQYASTAKIYVQELEADTFKIEPYSQRELWFALPEKASATAELEIDFSGCYGYDAELVFTLDQPLECTGKALLITVVNEAPEYIDNSSAVCFYSYMDAKRRSAVFYSDSKTFAENQAEDDLIAGDTAPEMARRDKPCTKFEYDETKGISSALAPDEEVAGAEGMVIANGRAQVYNLAGALVAEGEGMIAVPAGIYVVRTATAASKVIVK